MTQAFQASRIVDGSTFLMTWQQIIEPICSDWPLVDGLPVLGIPCVGRCKDFILPMQKCCFIWSFLGESLLEVDAHLLHCFFFSPCFWTFVNQDTDNNPLLNGVIACITHPCLRSFNLKKMGKGKRSDLTLRSLHTKAMSQCFFFFVFFYFFLQGVTRYCGHSGGTYLIPI